MSSTEILASPNEGTVRPTVGQRFFAFVLEQFPFALPAARAAWADAEISTEAVSSFLAERIRDALIERLGAAELDDLDEPTPMVSPARRLRQELGRLAAAVDGFFAREALRQTISNDERRWMLAGILLTRAVDNRMKQMFLSGELRYGDKGFQGKGFRSLGQEAIYAAGLRLQRGPEFRVGGRWKGDVVGPLIRDLGIALAFTDDPAMALNAQAGKAGPPLDGKDLHLGDAARGVWPAAAPLSISTLSLTGIALAMKLRGETRVAVSFIGEGGSSLGEWHEAINLAAARQLPMIFCVENNQTALSTPVHHQSAARLFAEKASGYGLPHLTLDGTDPEAIAVAFGWAGEHARRGHGPVLLELVSMRLCGHAHHDDMLYLGGDPPLTLDLPPPPLRGYADAEAWRAWAARDPLATYARRLMASGVIDEDGYRRLRDETVARVEAAMAEVRERPWPDGRNAGRGVLANGPELAQESHVFAGGDEPPPPVLEPAPPFVGDGATYLEAIARGVADVLERQPEAFVLGEDVAAPYGNAFLLLRPLLERHADRILNAPLAESAILGALVGAAAEGLRPLGEMQFNDFVATGFNQLVNNAAKLRYRTGLGAPFVLRMPWGGLRRAGPYHSQDTAPWFYRSFGLRIVAPSTPHDARALLVAAASSDDPVLYYEHIALYRDPGIKQALGDQPGTVALDRAAFRRLGDDLSLISYGAYVHKALACAERVEARLGKRCDVLDLRSLAPLDWPAIFATARKTHRVLLVGEDSRTGSILESIASRLAERAFPWLDAPVRVVGALDAPVPYAPSLEDAYLVSDAQLDAAVAELLAW